MTSQDPTYLLRILLEYSGFTKEPGKVNRFYTIISKFTPFALALTFFSLGKYAFEDHLFFDKGLSMEGVCSVAYLSTKVINVRIRLNKFWQIMNDASIFWTETISQGKYLAVLENHRARVIRLTKIMMLIYIVPNSLTITFSLPTNLLMESENRELIYKIWDPFRDTLGEDYFWLRYTYEAIFVGWTLLIFGVAISMLVTCTHMACLQMEVLIEMLQEKTINVNDCIRLHQKCLKFARDLNDYYAGLLLIELFFAAIVISLRIYVVVLMWKALDPRVYFEMAFLLTCMLDPFMVCYSGQIIMDMNEKIFKSSYQNEWYCLSIKDQKSISLLMCQSSRTLKMQYKGIMTFDMVRYGMVLQGTYSYITILLQF